MSHVLVVLFQGLLEIFVGSELDEGLTRRPTVARKRQMNAVFTARDPGNRGERNLGTEPGEIKNVENG